MCNSKMSTAEDKTEQLDRSDLISDQMATLFLNADHSDVVFLVEGEILPAHRLILATRCDYFRAMLFGGFSETTLDEVALDAPLEAFKRLLRYLYTGRLMVSDMANRDIFDAIALANEYGILEIEPYCTDYLKNIISVNNICAILDMARLNHLEALADFCFTFMDHNAHAILKQSSTKDLSKECLEKLLERDSFFASELEIFVGLKEWHKHNTDVDIKPIASHIRLSLMNEDTILGVVRESGIFDLGRLLDAIQDIRTEKRLPYRGLLRPFENLALESNAKLPKFSSSYPDYAFHQIASNENILIKLKNISFMNHMSFELLSPNNKSYSYYLEVSVDRKNWECVVDHKTYECRSKQFLYFPLQAVKYIKLVGASSTSETVFYAGFFQATYMTNIPKLVDGFVAPTYNIATVVQGATSYADSNFKDDDEPDYKAVVIQLGQPYYVGSFRMLFEELSFSAYIETSIDKQNWEKVSLLYNDTDESYQYYTFQERPVLFIRIVGTYNTTTDFFKQFSIECPAQVAAKV